MAYSNFNPDPDFANRESDIKKAVTKVTLLKTRSLASLLALEPITGRKHQLRVHCASVLNCFIAGDYKYGAGITKEYKQQLTRKDAENLPLHLHLYRICIRDWYGPEKHLKVVAPICDMWRKSLKSVGFDPLLLPLLQANGDIVVPRVRKSAQSNYQSEDALLLKEKEMGFDV